MTMTTTTTTLTIKSILFYRRVYAYKTKEVRQKERERERDRRKECNNEKLFGMSWLKPNNFCFFFVVLTKHGYSLPKQNEYCLPEVSLQLLLLLLLWLLQYLKWHTMFKIQLLLFSNNIEGYRLEKSKKQNSSSSK